MDKKYFCVIILFIGLCLGVSRASECTTRGRFPNVETNDCRGYTMCLMGGLTNFTQYKLMCPMGSVYSHLEEQCTNATNYKCYPTFNCTSVGNFAIPGTTDCTSFVACIDGLGSVGTARLVECPPNMLFNSTARVCVNNTEYTCLAPKVDNSIQSVKDIVTLSTTFPNNAVDINVKFSLLFFAYFLISVL